MSETIEIVSASAGSGKTYHLTHELNKAIENGVRPEAVLATTFTKKAASELTQRVRLLLLESKWEAAQSILDGYVGTVNSVCGRLLKDFAFEAGLSPAQELIPEADELSVFKTAADPVLEKHAPILNPIAARLSLEDWTGVVRDVITQARANALEASDLALCADKSWQRLKAVLPEPLDSSQEAVLDETLHQCVQKATKDIASGADTTQTTAGVLDYLRGVEVKIKAKTALPWWDWAKLAKLKPAKGSQDVVLPVKDAASRHEGHPRLHRDLEQYIKAVFACAAEAMQAFAEYKRSQGLIDYVDQESLTCWLLENHDVRGRLAEFLDIVFVDEFQDTSPIELAVFLKLAQCVDRSMWVGDQKQAVYGFRGTDPMLMDAAVKRLLEAQGPTILTDNWRSRPGLVEFTNHVFCPTFEARGFAKDQVFLNPVRKEHFSQTLPLEAWSLDSKKLDEDYACIASGVATLLSAPDSYVVEDPKTRELRSLRGGDIAVLCRKNTVCLAVANALERLGVRAVTKRKGLLDTPEAVFAMAALRYLVDPRDTLAVAELLHMSGQQDWLNRWLTEDGFWKGCLPISALDNLRGMLADLTPWETLDLAISASQAESMACRWGRPEVRLANLDALRGLAKGYEDICMARRNPATAAGLITYLALEVKKTDLDLQGQGVDEHAVNVITYHKAKGLEWPFVVLAELNWSRDVSPFRVSVTPNEKGFDPLNPLDGRWIRYWPWPYGKQATNVGLDLRVEGCAELHQARSEFWSEESRLMYVGMTRARDYLAFAFRGDGQKSTAWLDILMDPEDNSVLDFSDGEGSIRCLDRKFPATFKEFSPRTEPAQSPQEACFGAGPFPEILPQHPPARFSPSSAAPQDGDDLLVHEPHRIGPRIPVAGKPDVNALGEAVHGFLVQDNPEQGLKIRMAQALAICTRWDVIGIAPGDLVAASERLIAYLRATYGEGTALKEHPMHMRVGSQVASGWIDLVWQTRDGYVIVDHKSFLGQSETVKKHCTSFVPQLNVYADCLEKARGQKPLALLVHLPMIGMMVEIERRKT
ncbi:MAG: DNA helicase UvrD [Desulfovibrionales bacterium]|nr:MAG: DNA helicase UvrD [Desulfovibrionales bacterium]